MSKESAAAYACPVCETPLEEALPRCFRCETPLARWWPLEEALNAAETAATRRRYLRHLALVVVSLFFGYSVSALWPNTPPASLPAIASPPPSTLAGVRVPAPDPPPRVIRYRVQRGDSLWRIAAALTGDGRNWKELWPEYEGKELALLPGSVLTCRMSENSASPGHRWLWPLNKR
jgi:hypothetical protein